jgi:AAA+ ATPase superfamily predicted ATPase
MKKSLFKVSGTIVPPYFVGRHDKLKELEDALRGVNQDLVIIAPRRFGKTALMYNLSTKLKKNMLVTIINCLGMTRYADFNEKVVTSILTAYEQKYGTKKGLLSTWKSVLRDSITAAFRQISRIGGSIFNIATIYLEFRDPHGGITEENEYKLVEATFDFANKFAEENNENIILIFDEFQAISKFNGLIFEIFKKKMDESSRVRFVFGGSSIGLLQKVFLAENAPLYQMTTRSFLSVIDEDLMKKYIKNRFRYGGFKITEDALDYFWVNTQGIPFYFQKLGLICYSEISLKNKKIVDAGVVKKAFTEMLEEFNLEFEDRLSKVYSEQQQAILKAMSNNQYNRMSDIANELETRPSNISSNMQLLLASMTISKQKDGRYYITDEVFRRWIKRYILVIKD